MVVRLEAQPSYFPLKKRTFLEVFGKKWTIPAIMLIVVDKIAALGYLIHRVFLPAEEVGFSPSVLHQRRSCRCAFFSPAALPPTESRRSAQQGV